MFLFRMYVDVLWDNSVYKSKLVSLWFTTYEILNAEKTGQRFANYVGLNVGCKFYEHKSYRPAAKC